MANANDPGKTLVIFWFRRDLRLHDNAGLYHALKENAAVLPLFIYDVDILSRLDDRNDSRVTFIHETIESLRLLLNANKSDILVHRGAPLDVFKQVFAEFPVTAVYANNDYEPAARARDESIAKLCAQHKIDFKSFKDQCLFEKEEILTDAGKPYSVYTPYKRKVLAHLNEFYLKTYPTEKYFKNLYRPSKIFAGLTLENIGFQKSSIAIPPLIVSEEVLKKYAAQRDFPAIANGTSRLGIHLRFGTASVRELAREALRFSPVWLSELIWRDFFMQIIWHYPQVATKSFRPEYDNIAWRSSESDFKRWREGQTGYALVDAGMRELNATGHMHNRVRMVVASFLCKHLLIHWYKGERYFAGKLLDYDLSANNGNWQWAAGSGCDAAPYFRVFNPMTQAKKFDPDNEYIQKWVPEYGTAKYSKPMVEHTESRDRCLREYIKAVKVKKT